MSKRKLFDAMLKDVKKNTDKQGKEKLEIQVPVSSEKSKDVNTVKQRIVEPENSSYVKQDNSKTVNDATQEIAITEIQEDVKEQYRETVNKEIKKPVKTAKRKNVNTGKRKKAITVDDENERLIKKKTFELPSHIAKRLEAYAAIAGEFEVEIVVEAITNYLDRLGVPESFDFNFKKKKK